MKKRFITFIINNAYGIMLWSMTMVVACGAMWQNTKMYDELQAYKAYYKHAEDFLDELDKEYNWCDGYDPQEFYEAEWNVKKLRKEVK